MTWVDPSLLAVGGALTLLVLVGLWSYGRRRRLLAQFLGGRRAMRRLSRPDLSRFGLRRSLLLGLAGAALTIAAAEPRWVDAPPPPPLPVKRIVLAIDVSASMQAEDEAPTRLAQAVANAHAALDSLGRHEVGLLLFAGTTYPLAPPTLDHQALRYLLSGVVPRLASAQDPGTLLSVAIDESVALLLRDLSTMTGDPDVVPTAAPAEAVSGPQGEQLVVLITDGESGERDAVVFEAVERAREAEVGVYTIGVGREAGAGMTMPAGTYQLGGPVVDARGRPGRSRLREPLLRQIASDGGGAYAHGAEEPDVGALRVALADTGPEPEPTLEAAPSWAQYDVPFVLGAAALALILLESLLGMSLPVVRAVRAREAA